MWDKEFDQDWWDIEPDPDEFDEAFECVGCGNLVKLPEDYPRCYFCREDIEEAKLKEER